MFSSLSRTHWLLHNLSFDIKANYRICYNYRFHNYLFYRNKGYSIKDLFIVLRTSRKCFRLIYFNSLDNIFYYHTFKKSIDCANCMHLIYKNFHKEG